MQLLERAELCAVLYCPSRMLFSNRFSFENISAELFDKEKGILKNQSFAVYSDSHESAAVFLR